jgi:hypothetical protein
MQVWGKMWCWWDGKDKGGSQWWHLSPLCAMTLVLDFFYACDHLSFSLRHG